MIKVNGNSQTLLAKYIHNAFGERTIKVEADGSISTFMYNDQGQLVQEAQYNASKQKQKEIYWVWLDTLPIAQIEIPVVNNSQGSQTITYLHGDHLNTPRWATNASKQVVWSWQSDAYGATMTNEDPRNTGVKTNVPLRFPGQYFDAETGFHYNYFRTYIPDLGRYSQSDPIGLEGGWNTFGYVDGNPLKLNDPLGLVFCNYSISQHKLVCTTNDGATMVIMQDGVFSGSKAWGKGECVNNPDCSKEKNAGPIPPGEYGMNQHPNKDTTWNLNPVLNGPETIGGLRRLFCNSPEYRCSFQLHSGTISAGCITIDINNSNSMEKYERLNEMLKKDSGGFNWLKVTK